MSPAKSAPTTPRGSNADLRKTSEDDNDSAGRRRAPLFSLRSQSTDRGAVVDANGVSMERSHQYGAVHGSLYPPPHSTTIVADTDRPQHTSIGYVPNRYLQSSYRRNNYPTFTTRLMREQDKENTTRASPAHRAHSELALQVRSADG